LGDLLYAKVDFHVAPRPEDFNAESLPWRLIPEIAGAGYFYDLACHQLDLFDWFFGKPVEVSGKSFNRSGLYQAEDFVFAQISYESGMPLAGHWCFTARESEHQDVITLYGTKGTLEFSTFDFTSIRHKSDYGIVEYLPPNPENIQYWFIKNMVEDLQGIKPSAANSESAVRTNWIMDKILGKI
jgi:predicted dehydrogenase